MTAFMDYHHSTMSNMQPRECISPSLSEASSNTYDFGSDFGSQDSVASGYNQLQPYSLQSSSQGCGDLSKTSIRRLKNRESAARSRQKIKNKLSTLEKSMTELEQRKGSLVNEKCLIMHEIDTLEGQMLSLSMEQIKASVSPVKMEDSFKQEEFTAY